MGEGLSHELILCDLQHEIRCTHSLIDACDRVLSDIDLLLDTAKGLETQRRQKYEAGVPSLTHIGCTVYAKTTMDGTEKIMYNAGCKVFIECSILEASTFARQRQKGASAELEMLKKHLAECTALQKIVCAELGITENESISTWKMG